jgi:DNA-directed RNA polymerase subunit RPC12/RpoP
MAMTDGTRELLVRGIAAAKAKDKDEARFYLEWVLRTDADNEQKAKAYLWLSEVYDDPKAKRDCLENIIALQPWHPEARRGLAILDGTLRPEDMIDPEHAAPQKQPATPQKAAGKRFVCRQCGGRMSYDPESHSLTCPYCRRSLSLLEMLESDATIEEQDFTVALATARGHSRPESMRTFNCQGCGAPFMAAPQALALSCPFCGSTYVVMAAETRELIPPEAVIPLAISMEQAQALIRRWFEKNELEEEVTLDSLRGFYFPAWSFDMGGEIPYQLTPRKKHDLSDLFTPPPSSGRLPILMGNIWIPASHTVASGLLQGVSDYNLESLAPYNDSILAGWLAELYQIPLDDASLVARQKAFAQARARAETQLEGTSGDSTLTVSPASLYITAFKLILLPLWLGSYIFREQTYNIALNGQTGSIKGDLPPGGFGRWLKHLVD